jgi:hypothetical protein
VPNPAATQDEELICYAHRFFAMCGFYFLGTSKISFCDLVRAMSLALRRENPAIHKVFRNLTGLIHGQIFCPNHQNDTL